MYNCKNLIIIYDNISRFKSNIYTKNKIKYLIKRKEKLIYQYYIIDSEIINFQFYLILYSRLNSIINKIKDLRIVLDNIILSIKKIEKEEDMIMKVFGISSYPFINCLKKFIK